MSDLKSEYKFQYSTKIGDDILVVHGDNIEDFVLDIEDAISKVFGNTKTPQHAENKVKAKAHQETMDDSWCSVHDASMEGREGQYGFFYSHFKEVEGKKVYCNGQGWKTSK